MRDFGFFSGDYIVDLTGGGLKTVTTAGTRVQLSTSESAVKGVIIQAIETNEGYIAYGGSDVVAAAATRKGCVLAAGESILLPVHDLNKVYIDSTISGEKISYLPIKG